ncbi:MAG: hypothetical protein U0T69_13805 [Chitinophagales bacterium]
MAKRKNKKRDFKTIIVSLGILFSIILFVVKIIFGSVGWLSVFAPVIFAFLIVFLLTVLRDTIKKI